MEERKLTVAEAARAFLTKAKRMPPASVHAICNAYLVSLRSGSRRASYGGLRASIRELRAKAARKLRKLQA